VSSLAAVVLLLVALEGLAVFPVRAQLALVVVLLVFSCGID
jgi:hypothetical protein